VNTLIPVVLSGGAGTRLWPLSRTQFPKQFCELFDETLLTQTLKRVLPLGQPIVLTTEALRVLTERTLRDLKLDPSRAIYEPGPRNTAPAIALLVHTLKKSYSGDTLVGVFPADHRVTKPQIFHDAVKAAAKAAAEGYICTLGIEPTFAATGYGYIEVGDAIGTSGARTSIRFREKPDAATAEEFVKSGQFFWNAGMFVFRIDTMEAALTAHAPEVMKAFEGLNATSSNVAEVYKKTPEISIDYAVMEREKKQACVPCACGWSDMGSWDEIAEAIPSAEMTRVRSENNFAFSTRSKTIGMVGVSDLIVVDTEDALLIAKKGESQSTKELVAELKKKTSDKTLEQRTFEIRPWGSFEVLRDTDNFKSKVIQVLPGQQLSYQSHKKRAEHWVITQGHPEVVLNDEVISLKPGENVYIPLGAKHRIRNPSATESVEFVEVQVGTYFGEDDIIRYQDDYKRV
jgi:mannose-1-phosphate guanylyltransferase/mannose-6-phosphate isomerase